MKTTSKVSKPLTRVGPGEYKPDTTYLRIEDLPQPKIIKEDRNASQRPCPSCGKPARREHVYHRQLHDIGDLVSGRPVELHITYSQHHCKACNRYFMTDSSDVAPSGSQYSHRVIGLAVRVVVEDGWPIGMRAGTSGATIVSLSPSPPSKIGWRRGEKEPANAGKATIWHGRWLTFRAIWPLMNCMMDHFASFLSWTIAPASGSFSRSWTTTRPTRR